MASDFEHGGLKWVIDEVFTTLKQAREHFESFVEDDEDSTQLQFCITYLHQVSGGLTMLELSGAALLSEEIELLAQAIYDNKAMRRDECFEVLMRALIQLPDYLERLQRGARDLPMVLLPILNDLRAARGESLLTEGSVFAIDLRLANVTPGADNGINPRVLAKKARQYFQLSLLAWYKDSNNSTSLHKIRKVISKLKETVKTASFYQLFDLMEGFTDGLLDQGISSSSSTKQILGQLDRYIKQLIDSGEGVDLYSDSDELRLLSLKKNLLFYIAHSSTSSNTIDAIREFYQLQEVIPDEHELEDARASMGGANADLMETVTGVILTDLISVKEQLDVFVRNISDDPSLIKSTEHKDSLQLIITTMRQISDTLAMLGQNGLRNVLQEKIESLKSILDSDQQPDRGVLMEIASVLLFVESSVARLGMGGLFHQTDENEVLDPSQIEMTEQQKNEITKAATKEAKTELSKVKESIVNLINDFPKDSQTTEQTKKQISAINASLLAIAGVLEVLTKIEGSDVVKDCAQFIVNDMISDNALLSEDKQHYLADTITSLEYYLDAVAENQQDISVIESVVRLGVDQLLGRETEKQTDESILSETLFTWMEDVSSLKAKENLLNAVNSAAHQVTLLQHDSADEITGQMKSMIKLVGNDQTALNEDISSTLRWAANTVNRIITKAIELKEANEEPIAEEEPATQEELAEALAEEELVAPKEPAVPEEVLEEEPIAHQDSAVQEKESLAEQAGSAAIADIDDPAVDYPDIKKLETSDDIDDEIMEIFIEEADEEIEKITTLYPQWKTAPEENDVLIEIRRSFHTLKGSGRLVGAYEMGEFSWAFENLLNQVIDKTIVVDEVLFGTLEVALEMLPEIAKAYEEQRLSTVDSSKIAAYGHILSKGSSFDKALLEQRKDTLAETAIEPEISAEIDIEDLEVAIENDNVLSEPKSIEADFIEPKPVEPELPIVELDIDSDNDVFEQADSEQELAVTELDIDFNDDSEEQLNEVSAELPVDAEQEVIEVDLDSEADNILDITDTEEDEDEGLDLVLLEIFSAEAMTHIGNIEQYIENCHRTNDYCAPDEILTRSLHTLRGSSHMAEIHAIGNVSETMENTVKHIAEKGQVLDPELIQMLTEICHFSSAAIKELAESPVLPDENTDLQDRLTAKYEQVLHLEDLLDPDEEVSETISITEKRLLEDEQNSQQDEFTEEALTEEVQPVAETETNKTEADITVKKTLLNPSTQSIEDEYDDELLEIFVEEAEDLLNSSEQALYRLLEDDSDHEALNRLLRDMHTLKGGARMAGVTAIGDLSHSFETALEPFSQDKLSFSKVQIDLLLQVHDSLSVMIESLKSGQAIEQNSALLQQLSNIVQKQEEAPQNAIEQVYEEPSTEQEPSAEQEPSSVAEQKPLTETPPIPTQQQDKPESTDIYEDELLEIFLEEAHELMDSSESALLTLKEEPDNGEQLQQLLRDLHTIKGGARMAGITPVGDLAHDLETKLERITTSENQLSDEFFDELVNAHDILNGMFDNLEAGKPLYTDQEPETEIEEAQYYTYKSATKESKEEELEDKPQSQDIEDKENLSTPEAQDALTEETQAETQPDSVIVSKSLETKAEIELTDSITSQETIIESDICDYQPPENFVPQQQDVSRGKITQGKTERVRVSAEVLDELVNYAGEVSIYRSRLDQSGNEVQASLNEMTSTIIRMREQLRRFEMETEAQIQSRIDQAESLGYERYEEFDPLEFDRFSNMQQITRAMAESIADLDNIENTMVNLNSESDTLLIQQGRVNTELQEGLMRTRMVPFKSQLTRFRRLIRQTSNELSKEVIFELHGGDQEIDRRVLEKITAPLEHLLRNAIAHGIETPEQRKQIGKTPKGYITLFIDREGSEISIKILDDGRGLDINAIKKKAVERSLILPDAELSDKDISLFILESGFTTAAGLSQISGRGVGMDVVMTEIKQLNGTLEIDSQQGKGSVFKILMPLTMSVSRALMVQAGEEIFAIPLVGIENIIRESRGVLEQLTENNNTYYQWHDEQYQFMHLGSVLGINNPILPAEDAKSPILLARSGDKRVAIFVDGLMGSREIVVKSVGPQLSTVKGVTGATILGDGKIALILDLAVLAREASTLVTAADEIVLTEGDVQATVMVVDDSITVRKVTQRLLKRHDYNVITAKDGVDAISVLHETLPDVMLLDIEMPRMDGFELATHMRDDERFKKVPIIMITSRTGDKHKDRAMKIGVNAYMGKPFQEHDLIAAIKKMVNK